MILVFVSGAFHNTTFLLDRFYLIASAEVNSPVLLRDRFFYFAQSFRRKKIMTENVKEKLLCINDASSW